MGTGRGQIRLLAAHPPESGPFSYLEDCLDKTAGILKGIDGQKDDAGYSDKTGKRLAQLKEERRLLEQLLLLYKEKSL